jgi:hypothetical protein
MEMATLLHSVQPGFDFTTVLDGAFNLLFAYGSDAEGKADPDYQLKRLIEVMREEHCDPLSGKVSMICVPPYGFWKIGLSDERKYCWQRIAPNNPIDCVAWFIGCISNATYLTHARRQGRDPTKGLEGGIGMYLPHPFETFTYELDAERSRYIFLPPTNHHHR